MRLTTKNLTDRDKKILLSVFRGAYNNINQITKYYFPSKKAAYERLRYLVTYHYLKRVKIGVNVIFMLDYNGKTVITEILGVKTVKYNKHKPSLLYYDHNTVIEDFRLALENSSSNIKLNGFISSVKYAKLLKDSVGYIHIPDFCFKLKNGQERLFFGEIDRGTEQGLNQDTNKAVRMIRFYLDYMQSGKFREKYRHFKVFWTLIVCPSWIRVNHLQQKAKRLDFPNQYFKFIWFTIEDNIKPNIILTDWQSLDGGKYAIR